MVDIPAFTSHSPLESLARRTSAKKPESPTIQPYLYYGNQLPQTQPTLSYHPQEIPQKQSTVTQRTSPSSPLLHSHFARNSTATASSNAQSSYLNSSRSSVDSNNIYQEELEYHYYDDESIYSNNTGPALRDSWQSTTTTGTLRGPTSTLEGASPTHRGIALPSQPPSPTSLAPSIPTVIVSSPTDPSELSRYSTRAGRAPIVKPVTSNFSRPARPLVNVSPETEEQKRKVLERNIHRAVSPAREIMRHESSHPHDRAQLNSYITGNSISSPINDPVTKEWPQTSTRLIHSIRPGTRSPSPHDEQLPHPTLSSKTPAMTTPRSSSPSIPQTLRPGRLPNRPPSPRVGSPISLYSTYSFYQLDSATPSPTNNTFQHNYLDPTAFTSQPRAAPSPPAQSPPIPELPPSNSAVKTPQECLQLGIQHHEANRLEESAIYFEKSAKESGGCGVGMLMWGLALRHGWGCEKNEKSGFKWLRRAAESAVEDLENARTSGGVDLKAVQTELVLAIYEVGQCFFQGWGVTKDHKMAVSYYTVAARLGDPDAQCDLAFCLANGKGCKKSRKEAAKWYRAAVAQGQSDIGLAWIYKEKYQ